MRNISVIGGGYVGLVTAACFADLGHKVSLLEIDLEKLSALEHGVLPVTEPELPELWERNSAAGRLDVTNDYAQGLCGAEFVFIAVGTPSTGNGKPDLKWVRLAAEDIAKSARGPMIVVIKSTVPVGTAELVARILARHGRNNLRMPVVSNPEFVRESSAVFDFMHPIRVVVGASDRSAADAVAELYAPLRSPIIFCDNRTAEMSKYASNVFRATRVSFINEIALLCDAYGVDVEALARIAPMETRSGESYLSAGLGWGGGCLPKDVRGLIHMAKTRSVPLPLLRAVQEINQRQPEIVLGKLRRLVGSLEDKTIGLLGLSFKPNSDDMREASSLSVIRLLEEQGCRIRAYDPLAMERAAQIMPKVTYCANAYEVAKGSDALILVTEWDEFRELDIGMMRSLMNRPILIDGRNLYDPEEMVQAGFIYEGIGRRGARQKMPESVLVDDAKGAIEPVLTSEVASIRYGRTK